MLFSCATLAEMAMTTEDFHKLLTAIEALSLPQLTALDAAIRGRLSAGSPAVGAAEAPSEARGDCASIAGIEARFEAEPVCPRCQSAKVMKWGSSNGLRRYRCKACKVTFNALTGTPLAQLHKRELWAGHAQALADGISLRKVAARLDVHLSTAFRWRHRFLKAPKAVKPKVLEGTVEADETYFLYSEKGSRKLDRPARKRGGKASKRGLSDEQVPVLIARDRNNATADEILPDRSAESLSTALKPVIAKTAVLVSDGAAAYCAFANKAGLAHVPLNLSAGERVKGIYHIQNVNNYDSRLKGWMRRFNGVATKYLDSYLGWHRACDRNGGSLSASRALAGAWGWLPT
jgi:transposase-like protein